MFSYNCGSRGGIALLVGATLMGLLTCPVGAQQGPTKSYTPGTPIDAFFVQPAANAEFADASYGGAAILITVYASDYDNVTYTSADGSKTFTNKEREVSLNLQAIWQVVSGEGEIDPRPGTKMAEYTPPQLNQGENSRSVTIRCTVRDNNQTEGRKDSDKVIERTFTIVKKPTIANLSVTPVDAGGYPVGSTPIASGYYTPTDSVFLLFTIERTCSGRRRGAVARG